MIIQGYVFSILYAVVCIALAILAGKLGAPKKYTRKIVHILVGFEWVILTWFKFTNENAIHFLLVCLLFTMLLFVDFKLKLLPAMSSDSNNAPGTVYYAVAMSAMAAITLFEPNMIYPFGIGVFCTSFGDGFAAVVGQLIKKCNPKIYGNKSIFGTVTNLLISFFVPFVFANIYDLPLEIYHCIFIGILSAELELFTGFGLDNIIITVSTSLLSYLFIYNPEIMGYIVPILVTPLIIGVSYKKKALTLGGIFAAIGLDIAISISLGNFGFTILTTFFAVAILVDKIKKVIKNRKKLPEAGIEKKGDRRDSAQVFANGLVAAVCSILYLIFENHIFIIAFVASLAEALADTAASGIGSLSNKVFDVFRMKKCIPGESGGMSIIGTVTSLLGSFLVALVAFCFGAVLFWETVLVAFCAFLGAVFDSMLGSLVQVKYKCTVCNKILEKEEHCGHSTVKYRGIIFMNNDAVNFFSTCFSAMISIGFYLMFL